MTPSYRDVDTHTAALAFWDAGCSVVRVATDGTKKPLGAWKQYQEQRADRAAVDGWFNGGYPGLGVITGAVSGNLLMIELEGRAVTDGMLGELAQTAMASGLADLWRRVTASGYMEATPSGGVHLLVRSLSPVDGNTKLARRRTEDGTVEVLAETRGEGGFVVVAPSNGPVHATGRPWARAAGNPATIPDLNEHDLEALLQLFRSLDRMPAPEPAPPRAPTPTAPRSAADAFLLGAGRAPDGGLSPGDDYNARADWTEILEPHGWRLMRTRGDERFWLRPGKTPAGRDDTSATTGYGDRGDWLYVFSSSTEFETETTYSKFAAYALLEHGGDHSAAARALRAAGYGTPAPERARPAAAVQAETQATEQAETLNVDSASRPPARTYSRTDDGNAQRLVDEHTEQLRYCPQRGTWLAWDGARWRWDHAGRVHEYARSLARALPADSDDDRKHRQRTLSARSLRAMVMLATTDPRVAVDLQDLDARPYELNTPGGTIDLRTGQLHPADPGALHTRITTVTPDSDQTPTRWLQFLADTFAGDPAMTAYVQRLLGLALIGTVLEQVLPFAYGEGANGKTTLLGAVQRIVGLGEDGYAQAANAEMLLATQGSGHPTELARLAGARLVVSSELEDGQRFAEAKVKQLTGRDAISGRFMRQDFFTFTPTHSLWLLANHMPAVRAGGMAFWRRVRLIPFLHTVPVEKRDPHLEDHLVQQEGPGILAWLAQGAADYLREGLAEPSAVRAATRAYERDQDTVGRFVDEACQLGPAQQQGMAVKVPDLRSAYETWCRTEGESPVSAKALTLTLRSRYGVESDREKTTRWYRGLRLLDGDASPAAASDEQPPGWWQQ